MTNRLFRLIGAIALAALLGACAHPITLNADLARVIGSGQTKIDKAIGLHINPSDRQREVVGPGGGGDKVSYFPYRDMEAGLYAALSETFVKVSRVQSPKDPKVASEGLHYVITPTLTTTSSSPSLFTWPPTSFSVDMQCAVEDAQGRPVTTLRVNGHGRAEFDEFKSNPSLAAQRAAEDALTKLVEAIQAARSSFR